MQRKLILGALLLGLSAGAFGQSASGGGGSAGGAASAGASNGASGSAGDANATAPAGAAAGVPDRGPSGSLTPPPRISDPSNPATFSGDRDRRGSGTATPGSGTGAGSESGVPGSGIGGVLSPSSRTSITVNATTFRSLDADGNSGLSRSEISDPNLLDHFPRLDRNNDGRLSEQEYLLFGRDPDTR